jgi:hypothetical protein
MEVALDQNVDKDTSLDKIVKPYPGNVTFGIAS